MGLFVVDTRTFIWSKMPAYSEIRFQNLRKACKARDVPTRAPNTKSTHTITHASIAVRPSALGMFVVMVLKILTRTRKTVMRSVILLNKQYLPGTKSGGIRKLIQLTMTNMPEGR